MPRLRSATLILIALFLLSSCSTAPRKQARDAAVDKIECEIIRRQKTLAASINEGDIEAYSEHLAGGFYRHRPKVDNLDFTIAGLHSKQPIEKPDIPDRNLIKVEHYYGSIKLNRDKTIAKVEHGFMTASCLMCRAIRFSEMTTIKSVWKLEKDGQWRRHSNRIGPNMSPFEFEDSQANCKSEG